MNAWDPSWDPIHFSLLALHFGGELFVHVRVLIGVNQYINKV